MMRISLIKFFWGFLFLYQISAWAQNSIYLKIQKEGFQPIRLLVGPFTSSRMAADVRNIFINDLELSGLFAILDEQKLAELLPEMNNKSAAVENLQAAARFEAWVDYQDSTVSLTGHLVDMPFRNQIFKKRYSAKTDQIRSLVHDVADEVVYYLFGERGIASSKIVFVAELNQAKELALVDYDGVGLQQLTKSGTINLSPSWAPDGRRLAYTCFKADNPDLMIYYLKYGKSIRRSNFKGLNISPAWSPDAKKIALTLSKDGNAEIYVMDSDGNNLRRLTNHPAIETSPSWSPNGREIVFTSDRSGSPQVYIMDAEGANVRRLTYEGNYNDSPDWSPKGDKIAYVSREDGKFQIYTVDVNGENRFRVTDGVGNNENPSWSPHGLSLAFASNRTGRWQIYVINLDGTKLRQLTKRGNNYSPAWSPNIGNF
ncbi:Tol-Pal system beta propeller repeat protein TolB [candidate division KSB1 bacterium]|nr:Tol-Pal system beta propeller repeat protein TolB [candidate division KSB1 bacterium]